MNQVLRGNTLCSDGEDHSRLRRIIMKPLTASALKSLQERVTIEAEELVQRLVSKGSFCATKDLAVHPPISIVSNEVGLAKERRERMLVWADKMFDCFGPDNDRTRQALPVLEEMMHYATTQAVREKLRPRSWAESVLNAADRGEVDRSLCPVLMIDYMGPRLDTTIFGISGGVWLFGKHPEEWDKKCETPSLTDPHRFDVTRNSTNQLAFGAGPHMCAGINLARLEMKAIFTSLARMVKRFHIEHEKRLVNNFLRGFAELTVSVERQ